MYNQISYAFIKYAWITFFLSCLLICVGAYLKINHQPSDKLVLTAGILLILPLWFFTISDVLNSRVKNKPIWIMAILGLGILGPMIYLLRRGSMMNDL
jgi:Phospholipase_D-nuclease N-terminal